MNPVELLILRFLLASCGCLAAGLGVWGLTTLCRRLPGFSSQRAMWMLSQITVVATFMVILLPHSERLRLVPPIDLDGVAHAPLVLTSATVAPAIAVNASLAPAAAAIDRSWLAYGAQAWLLVYLLGLGFAVIRLLHARRVLNGLAATGKRLTALDRHDGFGGGGTPVPTLAVIEVDAPISPMLFGLFRPRLLLPRHLRGFEPTQQQMIIEHELTHLRRRDLQWISVGVVLQTLFWFNPFMRLLRENLAWAQELGCDRDVLQRRPPAQRKAYAAALVAQLRLQQQPVTTALAFGAVDARTLAARISLIREPGASRGPFARLAASCGLAAIFVGSLMFQPTLASRLDALPAASRVLASPTGQTTGAGISCTALADAASGKRLVHEGQCDERVTPASTFNIAVSLMGFDSGILRDEHTPRLPFRAGYADWNPDWRSATDPQRWLEKSVVWYAQHVTARLGAERFERYIEGFNYGNRDVSGDPGKNNGLALSWISSSLEISPAEQVAFLTAVVNRNLSLSPEAYEMTSRILPQETLANGWVVHGKTGTASPVLPNGRDDLENQYGWYVGWAKKGKRTIVFARLVLDKKQKDVSAGPRVKQAFLRDLPARLDAL